MPFPTRATKWLFYAGIAVHVLLCILSLFWYRERLVLPDDANYLFELLSNDGGFAIFHNRFIALPTQILPWIAIRAGADLGTVARLYALNVELFYAACYCCTGFLLRNRRLALAGLIFHLLITTDTFFWSVSELPLSLALLFPLAALMERKPLGALDVFAIALLCITVAFGHSLALFAFGFCLALLWLLRPDRHRVLLLAGLCFGAALTAKAAYFSDPYDRGALGGLKNFGSLFPHYLDTPSMHAFLQRCRTDFIWMPITLAIILTWQLSGRRFGQALILATAFAGYLLLVTVCFSYEDPTRFYPENLYLPLAFFLAFAFPLNSERTNWPQWIGLLVPVLIIANSIGRIIHTRQRYLSRLEWQRGLIRQYEGQKVILPESAFSSAQYLLSWSSPYEFWLLSSVETGRAASIVITKDPQEAMSRAGMERKAFLPAFGLYYYGQLPQRYFPFRDTASAYQSILSP